MHMMVLGRTITVLLADPSEVYEWLMSNPATPSTEDNMDAVGWERWLMAVGVHRLFASEYGRRHACRLFSYNVRTLFS